MRTRWILLLLLPSIALGAPQEKTEWSKETLRSLLTRIQVAGQSQSVEAKDNELVNVCGAAYNVPRAPNEPIETYAKRILRSISPQQPEVKQGQWLLALMQRFYEDAAKRCARLARFELERRDRQYLETMAKDAKEIAGQLARMVQVAVEGLDGFVESLPIAEGKEPKKLGALAIVRNGTVVIERLDRVHFKEHQPPADTPRTTKGAIRELYSAQKQYNITAQMFAKYDKKWRTSRGHVQAVIPGGYPAIYLNELARGGVEADMHTLHVMVMSKAGKLQELELMLQAPKTQKRAKKRKQKLIEVGCADDIPMQQCVRRIVHALSQGNPVYRPAS